MNFNEISGTPNLSFKETDLASLEANLVIVTSVINCVKKELSYYHTRSVFTSEERYLQTLNSIESLKKIPNNEILFCECSDLSKYPDYEKELKTKVNYYYNFYDDEIVQHHVNSPLKGMGEAHIMLKAIDKVIEISQNKNKYKNIFKLSGRYFLNENFDFKVFDNDNNIFRNWDNCVAAYCTIFYKINSVDIGLYRKALYDSMKDLLSGSSIELCMYNYFTPNIFIVTTLNVSGQLATEGYLFNI